MFGINLPTYLQKLKDLVAQATYWAGRARHWAYVALTGVGVVHVEAETTEITAGTENDRFTLYVVNDDLNTVTFFLVSNPIPGTSFQILNDGHGIVQVQALDGGTVSSPGTLVLRGNGALVSLVAIRAEEDGLPARWAMFGDVEPL